MAAIQGVCETETVSQLSTGAGRSTSEDAQHIQPLAADPNAAKKRLVTSLSQAGNARRQQLSALTLWTSLPERWTS